MLPITEHSPIKGKHILSLLVVLTVFFVIFRHFQTYDLAFYHIYFERDVYRAANILNGHHIFYGPELWAGGNTPGPFLYYFNSIALLFFNHPVSIIFFIYIQLGLSLLLLYSIIYRYLGVVAAAVAVLLAATNNYLFLDLKNSWNPTELFFLYSVFIFLLMKFFSDKGRVCFLFAASFLVGLVSQVHLSFFVQAFTIIILIILLRRDIGWKGGLSGALFLLLPLLPYLIYFLVSGDPFLEGIFDRKYTGNVSYYETYDPRRIMKALELMFWGRPGNLNHEMSFLSAFLNWGNPLLQMIHDIILNLTKFLVSLVCLLVIETFFVRETLNLIAKYFFRKERQSFQMKYNKSVIVSIVLLLVPSVFFFPFLGNEQIHPFHYYYIALFPFCIFVGVCFSYFLKWLWPATNPFKLTAIVLPNDSYASLNSMEGGKRGFGIGGFTRKLFVIIQSTAFGLFIILSIVGIGVPLQSKFGQIGDSLLFFGDAVKLSRMIIDRTGVTPEEFTKKTFIKGTSSVGLFPYLYEREYFLRSRKGPITKKEKFDNFSGLFISRGDSVLESLQKFLPVRINWIEKYLGYSGFSLYSYSTMPSKGYRYSNMTNMSNPYILSPENMFLIWKTKDQKLIVNAKKNNDGEILIKSMIELPNSKLAFGLNVSGKKKEHQVNVRIFSPFLSGLGSESGKAVYMINPRLLVEGGNDKFEIPINGDTFFSGLEKRFGMGGGDYYYNAPFEVYSDCRLNNIEKITFFADKVVNWRYHTDDADVSIVLLRQ